VDPPNNTNAGNTEKNRGTPSKALDARTMLEPRKFSTGMACEIDMAMRTMKFRAFLRLRPAAQSTNELYETAQ
jgi:hypothetical protein